MHDMMDSDRVGIWYTDGNMDEVTVSGRVEGMDMPGPPDAKVRLETDKGIFTIPFADITYAEDAASGTVIYRNPKQAM